MSNWREMRDALQPPPPLDFNPWLVPAYGDFLAAVFAEWWWKGRQLTTGEGVPTRNCTCKLIDSGTQFAHWTDPHCPQHGEPPRPRPVRTYGDPPACMCLYGVRRVEGAPGPRAVINLTARYRRHEWGVWAFKIHPRCPHHGDARHAEAVLDFAAELGITLLPWQEDAIRAMYSGVLVNRPRRAGMETVRRVVAAYEVDGRPAWEVLDDQERRGD